MIRSGFALLTMCVMATAGHADAPPSVTMKNSRRRIDILWGHAHAMLSNAIRNCPLCVMKNCPHHWVHDLG